MKLVIPAIVFSIWLVFSSTVLAENRTIERDQLEALEKTAEYMAKSSKISYEDALRQLKLQSASSDGYTSKLREEFSERLAGIYIEHEPVDRLVVRLTGNTEVASRRLEVDGDVLLVEFITEQPHTAEYLEKIMMENNIKLKESINDIQGMSVSEKTGEIIIDVYMDEINPSKIEEMKNVGEGILGVPVKIHVLSAKMKTLGMVRGGRPLTALGCTTGFVVKQTSSSILGVTTAGHCPLGSGITVITDEYGTSTVLSDQGGVNNATEDVRWYKSLIPYPPLAGQMKPEFYGISENIPTKLKSSTSQSETKEGDIVCHRGMTTGYSCGRVFSKMYSPSVCGDAPVCASTWVAVDPSPTVEPTLACAGGDSGGPWFSGTQALGIMHSASSVTEIGLCLRSVYMSTDRLSVLGVQLLYAP